MTEDRLTWGCTVCELGCSHHLSERAVMTLNITAPLPPNGHLRKAFVEVNIKMCPHASETDKYLSVIVNVLKTLYAIC